jgi:hypothetical protein
MKLESTVIIQKPDAKISNKKDRVSEIEKKSQLLKLNIRILICFLYIKGIIHYKPSPPRQTLNQASSFKSGKFTAVHSSKNTKSLAGQMYLI